MPLQNRVLPTGEIVAIAARGSMMGNRGVLHRPDKTLGTARWRHKAWICCLLRFKDRRRPVMAPRRYTELFFLDEAVAFAAGHRPCAECRRDRYRAFHVAIAESGLSARSAAALDSLLHEARVGPDQGPRPLRHAELSSLPAGTFVLWEDRPHLVTPDALLPYAPDGYGAPVARPGGALRVPVLTPRPICAALASGYRLTLHSSAAV